MTLQKIISSVKSKSAALLLATCTMNSFSYADTSPSKNTWKDRWHPVFALGTGVSTAPHIGVSQYFPIRDPIVDEFYIYSSSQKNQSSGFWDLLLAAEWNINQDWMGQAGLDYNQTAPFKVNGTFTQGADMQSADTFSYQYKVLTKQLLVNGKLLYTLKNYVHPYLSAGLGTAFNKAYHYYTNVPANLTFTRMHLDHTNTSLSYALGIGIDTDINKNLRAGIGYRFTDLGTVQLGKAFIDTSLVSGTLANSNFQTNEVLIQLTWVFN
ncbi:outer membrane protein [Legionella shakespearei]|uniref:Outer membrane protein beta-barrel domain-containing protein n=1 Tax=Legionella shakespearei DSM 23087 TaxID=1122169 RepID=A0A0W0Z760_9GAMM|nr:outer membrane beta-barrel protein [Legionella shakespearei]KTD64956.1 hypothetical protein Lsha_0325 [Legionella shakespearei DSM 23087]